MFRNTYYLICIQNNPSVFNDRIFTILYKTFFYKMKSSVYAITTCQIFWIYYMTIWISTILGYLSPFVSVVPQNIRYIYIHYYNQYMMFIMSSIISVLCKHNWIPSGSIYFHDYSWFEHDVPYHWTCLHNDKPTFRKCLSESLDIHHAPNMLNPW